MFIKKRLMPLVIGVSLLLSGCGSKTQAKVSADESNTLVFGCGETTGLFSPLYSTSSYDNYVMSLIYDSLLTYDKHNKLVPAIAESMPTYSNGNKTLTYKIKKGVKFSDGTKLTTKDIRMSFEVTADHSYTGPNGYPATQVVGYEDYNSGKSDHISGIKLIDDYTISFTFKNEDAENLLHSGGFSILSDQQFKDYKNGNSAIFEKAAANPIGTGPYKLVKYSKSSGVGLTKNKLYWGDGYDIKNVIIKPVTPTSSYEELSNGNIDVLEVTNQPNDIGLASKNSDISMKKYPRAGMGYICFNAAKGPSADMAVRQALSYALDRQAFVDSFFDCPNCKQGVGSDIGYVPTTMQNTASPLKDMVYGKEKVKGLIDYQYNLDKAKKILDDAGWKLADDGIRYKDGQPLSIKMMAIEENTICNTLIPMLKKEWHENLGVDFKITTVDFNTLSSKVSGKEPNDEWNVFFMAVSYVSNSMGGIKDFFLSTGGQNYAKISDPKMDALIEKAVRCVDSKEAKVAWEQVSVRANELACMIPLYGNTYYQLYRNDRVKNLDVNTLYDWTESLKDAKLIDGGGQ